MEPFPIAPVLNLTLWWVQYSLRLGILQATFEGHPGRTQQPGRHVVNALAYLNLVKTKVWLLFPFLVPAKVFPRLWNSASQILPCCEPELGMPAVRPQLCFSHQTVHDSGACSAVLLAWQTLGLSLPNWVSPDVPARKNCLNIANLSGSYATTWRGGGLPKSQQRHECCLTCSLYDFPSFSSPFCNFVFGLICLGVLILNWISISDTND